MSGLLKIAGLIAEDITNNIYIFNLTSVADLSEGAIDVAREMLEEINEEARVLIVSPIDAVLAGRIAEKRGLSVIVLPIVRDDSWALCGERSVVWSSVVQ